MTERKRNARLDLTIYPCSTDGGIQMDAYQWMRNGAINYDNLDPVIRELVVGAMHECTITPRENRKLGAV